MKPGELSLADFSEQVQRCAPEPLSPYCLRALHSHYRLLLRWNERSSLVGPGTLVNAVEVHYCEALSALPLLPRDTAGTLVDIGSGAGFPGFVLAAARPRLDSFLVEARERKWAFLKAAVLESGIRAECILGMVDRSLPAGFPMRVDWLTLRALKLPVRAWQALATRLSEHGRVLVWAGREEPSIPGDILRINRSVPLPGSRWKRVLEIERV